MANSDTSAGLSSGPRAALTDAEVKCLTMIAEGKRPLDICNLLVLPEIEVEGMLTSAERKLGARNRLHAVSMAILMGSIDLEHNPRPE
ncbi:MAG: LuxR C-terminal-related transcriptional regulator [Rhizobium sp.]|nr:LuxR C-terminal-related transcriptional regulator [Rhizobium sp.]MBW8321851.1 LuxR C-terminal-related transcriptional regulator [Rhizobium sp.]MBW8444272.1 LuxR C-terminal-related transcriptional regulator [Arenimonas sp.]